MASQDQFERVLEKLYQAALQDADWHLRGRDGP